MIMVMIAMMVVITRCQPALATEWLACQPRRPPPPRQLNRPEHLGDHDDLSDHDDLGDHVDLDGHDDLGDHDDLGGDDPSRVQRRTCQALRPAHCPYTQDKKTRRRKRTTSVLVEVDDISVRGSQELNKVRRPEFF